METFAQRIRERARELGLSDAEVARRAGLSERRYGYYATGEREPSPSDAGPNMRGPRRDTERFASTRGQAGRPIWPRPFVCAHQRRSRQSKPIRTRIGGMPVRMSDGASARTPSTHVTPKRCGGLGLEIIAKLTTVQEVEPGGVARECWRRIRSANGQRRSGVRQRCAVARQRELGDQLPEDEDVATIVNGP